MDYTYTGSMKAVFIVFNCLVPALKRILHSVKKISQIMLCRNIIFKLRIVQTDQYKV